MTIQYLNGNRLYYAVLAGGNAVIEDQVYLNKINVFPVPDSDTGTNLASTMRSIAEKATADFSFKTTLQSIAESALSGARGNSGLIFAQFLLGMSQEFKEGVKASTKSFGESAWKATHYAYKAILSPVEGTMVTVIKDWAYAVYQMKDHTADFVELFSHSLKAAKQSLRDTPNKLKVLAKAGVVDAGAKGFVDFLEGIVHFIKSGEMKRLVKPSLIISTAEFHSASDRNEIQQRFCTEALIDSLGIDLDRLREEIRDIGDSAIVAGTEGRARIHIHTNHPDELFNRIHLFGDITQVKVDDMLNQFEVSHNAKSRIALVTDSACDIPVDILEEYQIQMIPLSLMFGNSQFLDKVTIQPDMFYTKLSQSRVNPTTALPSPESIRNIYSFLLTHFDSLISIHLSDQLSGTYQACVSAAEAVAPERISV
ncbi:MAG: DAK2 domain-containing protein, partial [Candidatus Aminicenantes bacterium]|nr:DAK2 domain-containing protein [Candidatus Aminicenantes bacterium]